MNAREECPGYAATVHHSLLETVMLWPGVPMYLALGNLFVTVILAMIFFAAGYQRVGLKCLPIGIVLHFVAFLLTWGEPHRLVMLGRYVLYRKYYGVARWT